MRLPSFLAFVSSLGKGGMGEVVRAMDQRSGQEVAVKFLFAGSDQETIERQRQEARALAALSHPNVVSLIDSLDHEGQHVLVMELLEGGNLYDLMARNPELPEILRTFAQICDGLEYIHDRGLVHRDLKPGNILFHSDGTPKIADLGLVRQVGARSGLTQTGVMMGTAAYVSPEQILSTRETGPAGDLYSLGVTLFETLTGKWPFVRDTDFALLQAHLRDPAPSLRELRPDLPPSLDALMRRLLEKEPDLRPRSAGQVRQALLAALGSESTPELVAEPEFEPRQALAARDPGAVLLALSHDIRDPMNGITGNARLLKDANLRPSERQYVEALEASTREVRSLLQGLIDYTRLEFGRLRLEPVPTDVRGLVQGLLSELQPLARQRGLELSGQVDTAVPDTLSCDPLRLRQILSQTLSRALETTRQGQVKLEVLKDSATAQSVGLRVVVSAAHRTETTGGRGLLELALTQGLIEKMGGQFWEDESSITFTLNLPVSGPAPAPAKPQVPAHPMQILLVDDSLINQTLVSGLLQPHGHEVAVAGDGQVAVDMCSLRDFDVILMDLEMPTMNGLEATRVLRSQGNRTPIVALTGHEREDWTRRCLEAGMDKFLSKPVEEAELLSTLAATLAGPSSSTMEPPVNPERREDARQAFEQGWAHRLAGLDQAFRARDAGALVEVAWEIGAWLTGLSATPAARAAAQIVILAEEGRLDAALHARAGLLEEVGRLKRSWEQTSAVVVPAELRS